MSPLHTALARAREALNAARHPDGYWEGRLASSPLATAVCLCALADEKDAKIDAASAAAYLRKTQNADGGWGDTEISKSNIAATLLVLCANAKWENSEPGFPKDNLHHGAQSKIQNPKSELLAPDALRRAEAYVSALGGLKDGLKKVYGKDLTFQVPIRMTAAYAGLRIGDGPRAEWRDVDALPFELALAPRGLMGALRLPVVSYALPALVCVGLSRHAQRPSWFLPLRWYRASIAARALEAILKMQPQSGGFLEATPITAFCLMGLKSAGRGDHPVASNARRFIADSQRADGAWPVEVNLSVWNTTRAIDLAGAASDRSTEWLLGQQVRHAHAYTDSAPGGWGWNHFDGSVPDADDTSGAILALRRSGVPASHASMQDAKQWLYGLQNRDGGWPTFCRGWQKLPFDRSAPDLTAHALRALCDLNEKNAPAYKAGWAYLQQAQRKDGAFAPLWFGCETEATETNLTYGTTHVLFACAADAPSGKTVRAPALTWLRSIQNPDGGFGGCKGAPTTAEETGLALRALALNGAEPGDTACARAAQWLIEHQRADGSWAPAPIGFYFAVLWYYEELYPLYYALGGLAAWAGLQGAAMERGSPSRARLEPVAQA
ncbi:MAG: squalene--hopene cyclase [Planctomycetota bacterium]|nr:squalene--hopene cyclase [Planctomycetota bacterium]